MKRIVGVIFLNYDGQMVIHVPDVIVTNTG